MRPVRLLLIFSVAVVAVVVFMLVRGCDAEDPDPGPDPYVEPTVEETTPAPPPPPAPEPAPEVTELPKTGGPGS